MPIFIIVSLSPWQVKPYNLEKIHERMPSFGMRLLFLRDKIYPLYATKAITLLSNGYNNVDGDFSLGK